jgi:hypothetical protein
MEVKLKPGAWVDPAQMMNNIRRAGYTAITTDVRLTVTGKVEKRGDALVVVLDEMKTPIELTAAAHRSSPETAPHLAQHVGQLMQVEGYWQSAKPKELAVTAVKVEGGAEDKHSE